MRLWLGVCSLPYLSNESPSSSLKVSLVQLPACGLIVVSFLSLFRVFHSARRCQLQAHILFCLSYIRNINRVHGRQNSNRTTLGKAFYFTFSRVAPSQGRTDILSARCLQMNLFCCQTITQTLLARGLPIYLLYFFSFQTNLKLVYLKLDQFFSQFHFTITKHHGICSFSFQTQCLPRLRRLICV